MSVPTISVFKFVGTISLGLLTGISTTLSTLSLPSLLLLPTAPSASATLRHQTTKSALLTSYLRHITSFTLFSAYLLSPRRARHPYLLYTSILAFVAGPGLDWGFGRRIAGEERDEEMGEVNGEEVRREVDALRRVEGVRAGVLGVGFAMGVVGLWGDGA